MEGNEKLVEINSLSVQPADPRDPKTILIPRHVTAGMLERGKTAIEMVEKHLPNTEVGLSLHLGSVISPELVSSSNIPVKSVDAPSVAYPSETLKQLLSRPSQLASHLAWRLNSAIGLTQGKAFENRDKKVLEYGNSLAQPFLRVSVDLGLEDLLRKIPQDWVVAIEYDSEAGMTIQGYLLYVKFLRKQYPNLGISLDPAHVYEHFVFNEAKLPGDAKEATINFVTNFLRDPNASPVLPVLSVDINNVPEGVKTYGETHKVFTTNPAVNIPAVVESYAKYLRENTRDGRLCIEPSPRDYEMFVGPEGAYLLGQIRKFTE